MYEDSHLESEYEDRTHYEDAYDGYESGDDIDEQDMYDMGFDPHYTDEDF